MTIKCFTIATYSSWLHIWWEHTRKKRVKKFSSWSGLFSWWSRNACKYIIGCLYIAPVITLQFLMFINSVIQSLILQYLLTLQIHTASRFLVYMKDNFLCIVLYLLQLTLLANIHGYNFLMSLNHFIHFYFYFFIFFISLFYLFIYWLIDFSFLFSVIAIILKPICVESRRYSRFSMSLEKKRAFIRKRVNNVCYLVYSEFEFHQDFCFWSEEKLFNW